NLPVGIIESELEEEFARFGPLKSLWVARKPPGFDSAPSPLPPSRPLLNFRDASSPVVCGAHASHHSPNLYLESGLPTTR
ncbi:unnamed protein product, partial [Ostreobium quekettii]